MLPPEYYQTTLYFESGEVASIPELIYRKPSDLERIIREAAATIATDKRLDNKEYGRILRVHLETNGTSLDGDNSLFINATLFPTPAERLRKRKFKINCLYATTCQPSGLMEEHIPLDIAEKFFREVWFGSYLCVSLSKAHQDDVFYMIVHNPDSYGDNVHFSFSDEVSRDIGFLESIGIRYMVHNNRIVINPLQPKLRINYRNAVEAYKLALGSGLRFNIELIGIRQSRGLKESLRDGKIERVQSIMLNGGRGFEFEDFGVFGLELPPLMRAFKRIFGYDFSGSNFFIRSFDVEDIKRFEEEKEKRYITSS